MGPPESESADFGKYRLVRKLAQGGMAEIYLALESGAQGFERVVVVKRVLADLCKSAELVQMFLDEAKLAALLNHPNVVRTFDLGVVRGRYYLAMEYLAGEDLGAVLQYARKSGVALSPELVAQIQIGVADGLHYAHEMLGIDGRPLHMVHRDVSPSNVIVTYAGDSKLVDFGIARAESNVTKTAVGTLKGKVQYLAPEQVRGQPVDRRADLFAFGSLTHELLTGKRLFRRDNDLATLNAITREELEAPSATRPDIPPELDRIVMKCLERNPAQRYQTAAAVSADLRVFLTNSGAPKQDVALFLRTLFGEERRTRKVGVAQGSLDAAAKGHTPSWQLARSGDYSPISGHEPRASTRETPARSTPNTARHPTSGARPPVIPGAGAPTEIPTRIAAPHAMSAGRPEAGDAAEASAPPERAPNRRRRRSRGVLAAVVIVAFALVGVVGFMALRPAAPETPVVAPIPESSTSTIAALRFEGLPEGAKVRVDGSSVSSVGEVYLSPGTHKIQAEAPGFSTYQGEVVLARGESRALKLSLEARAR